MKLKATATNTHLIGSRWFIVFLVIVILSLVGQPQYNHKLYANNLLLVCHNLQIVSIMLAVVVGENCVGERECAAFVVE